MAMTDKMVAAAAAAHWVRAVLSVLGKALPLSSRTARSRAASPKEVPVEMAKPVAAEGMAVRALPRLEKEAMEATSAETAKTPARQVSAAAAAAVGMRPDGWATHLETEAMD